MIISIKILLRQIIILSTLIVSANYYSIAQEDPPHPGIPYIPGNPPENPPRPIIATTVQDLSFGAFCTGTTGGTVTIDPYGVRTCTGDIILVDMGYLYFPVRFQVDANPGTVISILNGLDITLIGSLGGTMNLHIGDSFPLSPFIANALLTPVNIGGTLTVGNQLANPPGTYSGTFEVTFNQE